MADEFNAISKGQYYCTISLGEYSRPEPFAETKWKVDEMLVLPLPSELRDDTNVDYANVPLMSVGDLINAKGPVDIGTGVVAAALRFSGNILSGGAGMLANAGVGAALGRFSQGTADTMGAAAEGGVAALFPPDQVTSAVQQATGLAPNPNPSVAFQGPILREFTFTWMLTPRNNKEAQRIKKLVATLKKRALPSTWATSSAAVLRFPYMCQLNFYPWDRNPNTQWGWNSDNSIIRIKKCVMQAVNVSYNPSNSPAFYYDKKNGKQSPVATQITINFRELEYLLASDWSGASIAEVPEPMERAAEDVKQVGKDQLWVNPSLGLGTFVSGVILDAVT